ncbi:hypothetical protein, partial [Rhodohalobacter sulfatireducens]
MNLENYAKSGHAFKKQRFFPTLETFWTAMMPSISLTFFFYILLRRLKEGGIQTDPKIRFSNIARPDPVLKYFSKATAFFL